MENQAVVLAETSRVSRSRPNYQRFENTEEPLEYDETMCKPAETTQPQVFPNINANPQQSDRQTIMLVEVS